MIFDLVLNDLFSLKKDHAVAYVSLDVLCI